MYTVAPDCSPGNAAGTSPEVIMDDPRFPSGINIDFRVGVGVSRPTPNKTPSDFPCLNSVTRPTVDTAAAAHYLNRRPQTLRAWACFENGPIRPLRINGRLAWPVAELRRLLGGE